jgi:hypothetical protein
MQRKMVEVSTANSILTSVNILNSIQASNLDAAKRLLEMHLNSQLLNFLAYPPTEPESQKAMEKAKEYRNSNPFFGADINSSNLLQKVLLRN